MRPAGNAGAGARVVGGMDAEAEREVADAFDAAMAAPEPTREVALRDVWAE